MPDARKISVVISLFNEEAVLPDFLQYIQRLVTESKKSAFEIIFVDDGSNDASLTILKNWKGQTVVDARIISFSRNFGHEAAMICGIDHATGDAVICMDSDLQHPPDLIPQMIESFCDGNDIVTMIRDLREDNGVFKNRLSSLFYSFFNRLSNSKLDENASDFFLISKRVADILRTDFRERNRFLRGFIQIVGFSKTNLSYVAPKRLKGKTKYSFLGLIKFSAGAIISFSKFPLYVGVYIGLIFAAFSLVLGVYTLWQFIFGNTPPSGYTTIVLFMSLSFSVLFVLIGIIGTYVGFIFEENKGRPIYIIKDIH